LPERPLRAPHRHGELERMNYAGNRTFNRLADEKMNVLRHDDITGHHEAVTPPHPLQRLLEKIARLRCSQMLKAVKATESEEVKAPRVFVSDESARHRWKAYNESQQMSSKSKTGLPRSVLSQVPKSEAPGAPSFSGCAHFSRHLGHPPPSFGGCAQFSRHLGHPPTDVYRCKHAKAAQRRSAFNLLALPILPRERGSHLV